MPHSNNPNNIVFDFIKKPVWRYDIFSVGELWKLWYDSSRFRKVLKPSQNFFSLITKVKSRRRLVLLNI